MRKVFLSFVFVIMIIIMTIIFFLVNSPLSSILDPSILFIILSFYLQCTFHREAIVNARFFVIGKFFLSWILSSYSSSPHVVPRSIITKLPGIPIISSYILHPPPLLLLLLFLFQLFVNSLLFLLLFFIFIPADASTYT
ncbi:GSCOCG00010887001-RA-CDS [Cotesia congregata]|nr:GSCOCG00010887001-RA-CDS [Cotesia congregata]